MMLTLKMSNDNYFIINGNRINNYNFYNDKNRSHHTEKKKITMILGHLDY